MLRFVPVLALIALVGCTMLGSQPPAQRIYAHDLQQQCPSRLFVDRFWRKTFIVVGKVGKVDRSRIGASVHFLSYGRPVHAAEGSPITFHEPYCVSAHFPDAAAVPEGVKEGDWLAIKGPVNSLDKGGTVSVHRCSWARRVPDSNNDFTKMVPFDE